MAEVKRYKRIDGKRELVDTRTGKPFEPTPEQDQGDSASRIAALEEKIRLLETVVKIQATSVEFLVPVKMERQLYVNGSQVT